MKNKLLSTGLIASLSLSNHPNQLPPARLFHRFPVIAFKTIRNLGLESKTYLRGARVSRSDHALRYSHYYTLKQFVNAILCIYMGYVFVTSKLIDFALFYICICDIQINQLR